MWPLKNITLDTSESDMTTEKANDPLPWKLHNQRIAPYCQ